MVQAAAAGGGLLGRLNGDLVLRIEGGPYDGQQLRIRAQRCSIGSAAGCTVRLQRRQVEPVHCLIVRGEAMTVVRTLAKDTRLNGRRIADHILSAGDRLAIGPMTFIVQELSADGDPAPTVAGADPARTIEWNRAETSGNSTDMRWPRSAEHEQHEQQLEEQQNLFRQWIEAADSTAREREADLLRRQQQLDASAAEIARRETELDLQRDQVAREMAEAHHRAGEEGARLASEREQLTAALAELEARQQELEGERNRQVEAQETIRRELESRRQEFEAAQATLEHQHAARLTETDQRRGELDERQRQFEARRQELDSREQAARDGQAAIDARRQEWEAERRRQEEELAATRIAVDDERRQAEEAAGARRQELEGWTQQLEGRQRDLDAREQAHTESRATLEREREQWQSEREAQLREIQEQRERLASEQASASELSRADEQAEQGAREQLESELAAQRQSLAEQQSAIDAQRSEVDALRAAFETERGSWEQDRERRQGEFEQRQAALVERETSLRQQPAASDANERTDDAGPRLNAPDQQDWQLERQRILAEYRQWQTECERLDDEQRARQAAYEAWQEERRAWESRVSRQQEWFDACSRELEQERLALVAEREQFEQARQSLSQPTSSQQSEAVTDHDAENSESDDVEPQAEDTPSAEIVLETAPEADSEAESLEFQSVRKDAPVSTANLFGQTGLFLPDDADDPSGALELAPAEPTPLDLRQASRADAEPPVTQTTVNEEDHESAVQNYMSQLLNRVNNKKGDEPTYKVGKEEDAEDQPAEKPKPQVSAEPAEPFEPRRRGAAAEFSGRLSALREVANLSARATLGAHRDRLLRRRQTGKLVVAITGVVSALFIAYLTPLTDIKARFGALVCFLAALVFGAQFLILAGPAWLQARAKRVLETLPEEAGEDEIGDDEIPSIDASEAAPDQADVSDDQRQAATAQEPA